MKTFFFFPPNWCKSHPYMSIPCILPYLKEKSIDVTPIDLNLLSSQYYHSKRFLDLCLNKIVNSVKNLRLVKKYELIHDFLLSEGENVENILHKPNLFLEYENYIFAKLYEDELRVFRSMAFNDFSNSDENKLSLENYKTLLDVFDIINNKEINYYYDFYDNILPKYMDGHIDIVLISLAGNQQIIPTLTLCKYIKEHYSKVKIILGGNPFTKIKNKIDDSWKIMFQQLFDYLLLYEGEYGSLINN